MPATGSDAFLHAELISREDSLALYGFSSEEERDLFRLLISVSGVGPKVAIATLSGGSARDLLRAIAAGDAKRFQAVPGIGKRTSERIIVELREKVAGALEEEVALAGGRGAATPARSPATAWSTSATRRWRPSSCSTGSRAPSPQELVAAALRKAGRREERRMSDPPDIGANRIRTPGIERRAGAGRRRGAGSTTPAPRSPTRTSTARCGRRPWRTSSTRRR